MPKAGNLEKHKPILAPRGRFTNHTADGGCHPQCRDAGIFSMACAARSPQTRTRVIFVGGDRAAHPESVPKFNTSDNRRPSPPSADPYQPASKNNPPFREASC